MTSNLKQVCFVAVVGSFGVTGCSSQSAQHANLTKGANSSGQKPGVATSLPGANASALSLGDNIWIAGAPVQFSNFRRVKVGNDYRTALTKAERDGWVAQGGTSGGSFAWVPWIGQAIYRLHTPTDSMDSGIPGEGGYTTEGVIGGPWNATNAPKATQEMFRFYNSQTGDHLTAGGWEAPGDVTQVVGYQREGSLGFGFRGWYKSFESIQTVKTAALIADTNANTGSAMWRYTYVDSVGTVTQFLNNHDSGRLMQGALFQFQDATATTYVNPTEAGDGKSLTTAGMPDSMLAEDVHGAPSLGFWADGTASSPVLHTRALPVAFGPNGEDSVPNFTEYNFAVGENIIGFTGETIGKDVTLNYSLPSAWLPRVAKYTSVFTYPGPINYASVQVPALYVRANFSDIWTYDATTNYSLQYKAVPSCTTAANPASDLIWSALADQRGQPKNPAANVHLFTCGGIIAADPVAGGKAIGIYGCNVAQGGSLTHLTMTPFTTYCDGTSEKSNNTISISAWYNWQNNAKPAVPQLSGTGSNYNSYIVVGDSPADVTQQMQSLYAGGVR